VTLPSIVPHQFAALQRSVSYVRVQQTKSGRRSNVAIDPLRTLLRYCYMRAQFAPWRRVDVTRQ
jgi:hypothetical protein